MATRKRKSKPKMRKVTLPSGRVVEVQDGVGEVTRQPDGSYGICDLGLAVRFGLATCTPEQAAEWFPILDLVPGERRAEPGEVIGGLPVFAWIGQADAEKILNRTGRWIQELHERGCPTRGHRDSREYPVPHLVVWHSEYTAEVARRRRRGSPGVAWLSFDVALARYRLRLAEDADERERRERAA